jgi:hypothetical protein
MKESTFVLPDGAVIDCLELTQAGWRAALMQVVADRDRLQAEVARLTAELDEVRNAK